MKKICLAFIFTVCAGVFSFGQTPTPTPPSGSGVGTGSGNGVGDVGTGNKVEYPKPPKPSDRLGGEITALRVLSKSRAAYTQKARENEIQGTVTLRVVFDASGKIGSISPISALPFGLTEQAIAAARQIKFEPAKRNGVPYSVVKVIQYNFIDYGGYLSEDDELLKKSAEILEMPAPELSPDEIKNSGGKIKISVLLNPQNGASLISLNPDWSKEFTQKIREAVVKIKFNPAIDQANVLVTQLKEIEYVFPE